MGPSPSSYRKSVKSFLIIFVCCVLFIIANENKQKNNIYYVTNNYIYETNETSATTKQTTTKTTGSTKKQVKKTTEKNDIYSLVLKVTNNYPSVDPYIVLSVIEHESNYIYDATNGEHFGLMQISEYWNRDRIERLNVTDILDPESNIRLGTDILNEFINNYDSIELALMLYNMDHDTAFEMHENGEISHYASSVISRAEEMRELKILE